MKNNNERTLIQTTQFIISTLNNSIRSTGNLYASDSSGVSVSKFDTIIVDGSYFDRYSQFLSTSGNREFLDNVGAISLDGIYVPYSTYPDYSGSLPRFTEPTSTGIATSVDLNPFNPDHIYGSGAKNPFGATSDLGTYNESGWLNRGHNITAAMVLDKNRDDISMDAGVHAPTNYFDADFHFRKKTEILDVRGIAFKTPSVWSGWGYNNSGLPVPADPNNSGEFHVNAFKDPSLWKTGPLDIRWDEARGVWSSASTILRGVVVGSSGCGYYRVALSTWAGSTPPESGVSASGCDFCGTIASTGVGDCTEETEVTLPPAQTTVTSQRVLAYDPKSVIVPLAMSGDCFLTYLGDTNLINTTPSGVGSGIATEPVYMILNGTQEHIIEYRDVYECCTVTGEYKKVRQTPIIFAGIRCSEQTCYVCPTG